LAAVARAGVRGVALVMGLELACWEAARTTDLALINVDFSPRGCKVQDIRVSGSHIRAQFRVACG